MGSLEEQAGNKLRCLFQRIRYVEMKICFAKRRKDAEEKRRKDLKLGLLEVVNVSHLLWKVILRFNHRVAQRYAQSHTEFITRN